MKEEMVVSALFDLGWQWRLEEVEPEIRKMSQRKQKENSIPDRGTVRERLWQMKLAEFGSCSWTAGSENRPGEAHWSQSMWGFVGCDYQFDIYPKSGREESKGVKHGSNMSRFVILKDDSAWRTE